MIPKGQVLRDRLGFDGFGFSPESETLYRNGKRVPLRPKEARLLALLVERRGEVVPREEIARALWPDTHVEVDGGLNSLMLGLRRTLKDWGGAAALIETVPKKGYRFTGRVKADPPTAGRGFPEWRLRKWASPAVAGALFILAAIGLFPVSGWLDSTGPTDAVVASGQAADNPDLQLSGAALGHYLRGIAAHERRDFTDAETSFRAALDDAPGNARLRYWLARSLINHHGYGGRGMVEAAALLRDIAGEVPDLAERARLLEGYIALYRDFDVNRADHIAAELLQRDPAHADARFLAIEAALARDDRARVIEEAERMIAIDPTSYASVAAPGWMFFIAGATERAVEYCRALADVEPDNRFARLCLLFSYLESKQDDQAKAQGLAYLRLSGAPRQLINDISTAEGAEWQQRFWVRYRERMPLRDAPGAIYMQGLVSLRLGEVDASIAAFERIIEIRPDPFLMWLPVDPRLAELRKLPKAAHLFRGFPTGS